MPKILYEFPTHEVVVDVITPLLPPPPLKTKAVKTKNLKLLTLEMLRNPANTREFVQGQQKQSKNAFLAKIAKAGKRYETLQIPVNSSKGTKTGLLKNQGKTDFKKNVPTAKCIANNSTLGCFDRKKTKKKKENPDWQLEEEKQVSNKFCKDEIL